MKGYRAFQLRVGGEPAPISEDQKEIVLGESGRGRTEVIVTVTGEGEFVRLKSTGDHIVAVRMLDQAPAPAPCIVAINSHGAYQKGRNYSIPEVGGMEKVAVGYSADGIAGRAGGGEHALCIVQPGTEFRLKGKYSSYWYTWIGNEWVQESPSERDARLALEEIEAGGGEWL